jgi:hypothetical protein
MSANILLGTPQILVKSGSANVAVSVGQVNMLVKVGAGSQGILVGTPQILVKFGFAKAAVSVVQPNVLVNIGSGPQGPIGPPGPSGVLQVIFGETPSGTIDGVNKDFASVSLYSSNLLAVFLNGLRQRRIADYTETGNQSFRFINAPLPGDSLSIDYIQS